jgi:hypothetical protein
MNAIAQVPMTRAQRDLYAESPGEEREDLERFAVDLVARVVVLVRHRCVRGKEPRALLAEAERVHGNFARDPLAAEARAAVWSLVETLTRRPWGPGVYGAIDRLVVAGSIADAFAVEDGETTLLAEPPDA